jgi:L-seryl-tRNA(Ser) seleniumtransferase
VTDPRRALPSVDALLATPGVAELAQAHPRSLVVRALRDALAEARGNGGAAPADGWPAAITRRLTGFAASSLTPVVNATGVVLHTNLGRAPLAEAAIDAITRAAAGYASLEFDLTSGTRGSRHLHCRSLLVELTGAADALVVNNAAGALLLALSALARGGEAIVSRGELVEIGGSFRIPDVMARSGALLVEVGSTNRTHRRDYERALGPATRLLLKVHRSNFQVTGFTAEVPAAEIAELGRARGAATLYDLGSGLLLDLSDAGLRGEPTVGEAVASGADIVTFSGDKLLGGPQAGILLGSAAAIAACRADPIARAVRADKLTLAGLEATLALYRDPAAARREIPVLRMLSEDAASVGRRADALAAHLAAVLEVAAADGTSEVGGGSFPGATVPTRVLRLRAPGMAAADLAARLRAAAPPVIARVQDDRVVLDPRTIAPTELDAVARAVAAAVHG